jgi:hypothetical protein
MPMASPTVAELVHRGLLLLEVHAGDRSVTLPCPPGERLWSVGFRAAWMLDAALGPGEQCWTLAAEGVVFDAMGRVGDLFECGEVVTLIAEPA